VAEWVARVYRIGKVHRVVVEGLVQFEIATPDEVEERTPKALLARLLMAYPTRAIPWVDPTAERMMEFEVAVFRAR